MVEQTNPIQTQGLTPIDPTTKGPASIPKAGEGGDFKSLLMESIQEVNRLQSQADDARINLALGKTKNVAEVFTAVKKAELAFQTLMQIRNKLMDAYEEIRQMRV
jgi:flagellar hook-basal body complex protein FliE